VRARLGALSVRRPMELREATSGFVLMTFAMPPVPNSLDWVAGRSTLQVVARFDGSGRLCAGDVVAVRSL